MRYVAIDPHSGEQIRSFPVLEPAEVRAALDRSGRAFEAWSRTTFTQRAVVLRRAATLLRASATEHARLMAEEMGKPVAAGRAEAEKCAWACDWYAEHADHLLADEPAATQAARSYVAYRPLGPILAIMPGHERRRRETEDLPEREVPGSGCLRRARTTTSRNPSGPGIAPFASHPSTLGVRSNMVLL